MHSFWHQVVLGNEVISYVMVALAIALGVIFKRLISKLIAGLLYRIAKRLAPESEKEDFVRLVIAPLESFLVLFITIVALDKLHFPENLNGDLYEITVKQILQALAKILLIVSFFWLLLRNIDFIALLINWQTGGHRGVKDSQHITFFRDFLKVVVSIIGLMMILSLGFGMEIGKLLAGLGLVGAALALAAKESIENLIASFIIFFDEPFTAGDIVKVNDITGTVEKIGLRSTRIRTDQKSYVTVPNKQMVDSVVDNQSLRTQLKGEIRLQLNLSTPPAQVETLIGEIGKVLSREKVESKAVLLNNISSNAILVNADYFVTKMPLDQFNLVKQEVNFAVLDLVEKLQIQMAATIMEVQVTQPKEAVG